MSDIKQIKIRLSVVSSIFVMLCVGGWLQATAQRQYDENAYGGLKWRMIGPFRGGRVNGVAGVAGEPNTFYFYADLRSFVCRH